MHSLSLIIFTFATLSRDATALSSRSPDGNVATAHPAIGRVAVIGAGVAGLTTAHCLEQAGIPYDIYEARSGLDAGIGAGIQLNGGLHVLGQMGNTALRDAVYAAGLPQERIQCRAWQDDEERDDRGGTSAAEAKTSKQLFELVLPQLIRTSRSSEIRDSLIDQHHPGGGETAEQTDGRVWWISILRSTLQETLAEHLPPTTKIQFNKQLVGLQSQTSRGDASYCLFADGTTSQFPYQLVISCEGINSSVKNIMQNQPAGRKTAIYSGIRIRFAVSDCSDAENIQSSTFVQHLGKGIYALDSVYGAGHDRTKRIKRCAFLVYLDPRQWGPFSIPRSTATSDAKNTVHENHDSSKDDENTDWVREERLGPDAMRQVMLDQLEEGGIGHTTLQTTVAEATQFFELGSYFHWPFGAWSTAPSSSSGGAHLVLTGDSAHALPPFLGQGSNQAMQDAYCLVQRLVEYQEQSSPDSTGDEVGEAEGNIPLPLSHFLQDYEQRRWPATVSILWKAIFLGYLETGGFDGAYAPFRNVLFRLLYLVGIVPRILLGAAVPKV